jgi:hypothetical protein
MITSEVYVILFVLVVLLLPPFALAMLVGPLLEEYDALLGIMLFATFVLDVALLIFIWRYNSLPGLSFWKGMCVICSTMMSGCANITMLYIFPVLIVVYAIVVVHSLTGVARGDRTYAQERWVGLIKWFTEHSLRGR